MIHIIYFQINTRQLENWHKRWNCTNTVCCKLPPPPIIYWYYVTTQLYKCELISSNFIWLYLILTLGTMSNHHAWVKIGMWLQILVKHAKYIFFLEWLANRLELQDKIKLSSYDIIKICCVTSYINPMFSRRYRECWKKYLPSDRSETGYVIQSSYDALRSLGSRDASLAWFMFDKSWTNRTGEEREIIPGNLHDDTNAPFQNLYHFGCILCDTKRKKKKETDFFIAFPESCLITSALWCSWHVMSRYRDTKL